MVCERTERAFSACVVSAAGSGSEGGEGELGRGGAVGEAGMAESAGSEATEEGQAMGVADPHEALQAVVTEKDHVHQENSLLQDHLMVALFLCVSIETNKTRAKVDIAKPQNHALCRGL